MPFDSTRSVWAFFPWREPIVGGVRPLRPRRPEAALFPGPRAQFPAMPDCTVAVAIRPLDEHTAPRAPPASQRWAIDALDGKVILLERETHPRNMPNARLPREFTRETPRKTDDNIVSFPELPAEETTTRVIDDQLVLIIEEPDPWAHESEPVFWMD